MKKQIKTEITINATTQQVWNTLTDFNNYPNWNPFITSIAGTQLKGETLQVTINPPNSKPMTFKPTIEVLEHNKELTWLGKLLFKGLFDGRHSFQLIDNKNGTTTLKHSESFNGLLTGMLNIENTTQGFNEMNITLKKYIEQNNS